MGDARARSIVGAYADFSSEAGDIVAHFFDAGWIDGPVRPDKRTGAFCATTVPGVHPYVLMNYTGDRRSVLTLAHELGHGAPRVPRPAARPFNASTPLTTAETASVFGEALTFERLLAGENDPRRRLDLLTGRIEDAIATTFRQIAMNRFEDAVHTERREQGELSSERIGELWLEAQTALFGDSVGVEGYAPWWSYIPHFTGSPGYVYAYAYGYLFALAIYRRYVAGGRRDRRAVPRSAARGRLAVARGAREHRRARPHRPGDLGLRDRRARGRARRGRAPREPSSASANHNRSRGRLSPWKNGGRAATLALHSATPTKESE